jgi:hypothetical protein
MANNMTITSENHYNLVLDVKIAYHICLQSLEQKLKNKTGSEAQLIKKEMGEIEEKMRQLDKRLYDWRNKNNDDQNMGSDARE